MLREIACECGNKNQDRFYAVTPVVGYEKKRCGSISEGRPIRELKGWRCQDCQKVHSDS